MWPPRMGRIHPVYIYRYIGIYTYIYVYIYIYIRVVCKRMDQKNFHNAGIFFVRYFVLHNFFMYSRPISKRIWSEFANFKIVWTQWGKEVNFCPSRVRHVMDGYIRIKNKVIDKKHLIRQFINSHVASTNVDNRKLIFIWKPVRKKVNFCPSHVHHTMDCYINLKIR